MQNTLKCFTSSSSHLGGQALFEEPSKVTSQKSPIYMTYPGINVVIKSM